MILYEDTFFKSLSEEDIDILKSIGTHKYIRKEGNRYIYKEREMSKENFHDFMSSQLERMKKFKSSLTKALGEDLGDSIYHFWVEKFSKSYRELWMRKHNMFVGQ